MKNNKKYQSLRVLFLGGTPRGLELMRILLFRKVTIAYAAILKEDDHEPYQVSEEIQELCQKHHIPFCVCKRLDDEQLSAILKTEPTVGFACSWRSILPEAIYEGLPQGCLVAHDSLLPKYRGFAPTSWAIINGETKTGVTLFKIKKGPANSGDIFRQKSVTIGKEDTAEDIYPRLVKVTVSLFEEYIESYNAGTIKFTKQDERKATYACRRTPEDGRIDWNRSARDIFNLTRALTAPYPPAWTTFEGKKVFIKKASLFDEQRVYEGNIPGRIASCSSSGVVVLCGQGQILLKDIVLESGETLKTEQLLLSSTKVFI